MERMLQSSGVGGDSVLVNYPFNIEIGKRASALEISENDFAVCSEPAIDSRATFLGSEDVDKVCVREFVALGLKTFAGHFLRDARRKICLATQTEHVRTLVL